ncbi:hypothetical protein K469DRAFT_270261 [Zopfia rhizophila CBS 207.26]|uniref:Uncharacterized protein n=1 Tax=Zopfia rhizophila CBS 207.26 TaxID=1314779 RepID=A0A6A6DQV8_9PEZI|nr:hypothetical protein K469DRAFT_270261 [Zopfia rhizophila CBS 207.26]
MAMHPKGMVMEELLDMANRHFGSNGWLSEIRNTSIDFVDSDPDTGRTSLEVSLLTCYIGENEVHVIFLSVEVS